VEGGVPRDHGARGGAGVHAAAPVDGADGAQAEQEPDGAVQRAGQGAGVGGRILIRN